MTKLRSYGLCMYKIKNKRVKLLLCRSITNVEKWGFLKGTAERYENGKRCAQREFFEESSIFVQTNSFEKYFEQKNPLKDVGIWLVDYKKQANVETYFIGDILEEKYICEENCEVRFFDIDNLPKIKSKQVEIVKDIQKYFKEIL